MIASSYPLAPVESTDLRTARRRAAPFLPLSRISVRAFLWSVLLGIGIVCPLLVASSGLNQLHSAGRLALAQQRWIGYVLNPFSLFLEAVLIYPLIEEVFYRGLILQLLRRYCPLWLAGFVSSALFGAALALFLNVAFMLWKFYGGSFPLRGLIVGLVLDLAFAIGLAVTLHRYYRRHLQRRRAELQQQLEELGR